MCVVEFECMLTKATNCHIVSVWPYMDFQPTVDVKTVLSQLMERLSNYASSSEDVSHLWATVSSQSLSCLFTSSFFQVLPEFLQVEAFAKLSSAIGKVESGKREAGKGKKRAPWSCNSDDPYLLLKTLYWMYFLQCRNYMYPLCFFSLLGREESPCSWSDWRCGPWNVQRHCSS